MAQSECLAVDFSGAIAAVTDRYYSMFEGTMPGGRALVSSTLTLPAAKLDKLANIQPAVFDKLISLDA